MPTRNSNRPCFATLNHVSDIALTTFLGFVTSPQHELVSDPATMSTLDNHHAPIPMYMGTPPPIKLVKNEERLHVVSNEILLVILLALKKSGPHGSHWVRSLECGLTVTPLCCGSA